MNLVWFFKIRCHLRQEFIGSNSNVDSKTKFIPDFVLDFLSQGNRIWIDQMRTAHIQEDFVNGKRLHNRCIGSTDRLKRTGAPFIQSKIPRHTDKFRTFLQCHGHRFSRSHSVLFRRNRFCHDNAAPRFRVSSNAGWNLAKIRQTFPDALRCFP